MDQVLNDYQDKFKDFLCQFRYYQEEIELLQTKEQQLKDDLRIETQKIEQLQQNQKNQILVQFQPKEINLHDKKETLLNLQNEYNSLAQESKLYKQNCESLSQRINNFDSIFQEMNGQIEEKEEQTERLNESINQLTEKLKDSENLLNNAMEELQEQEDELKEVNEQHQDKKEILRHAIKDYRDGLKMSSQLQKLVQDEEKSFKKLYDESNSKSQRLSIIQQQQNGNLNKALQVEQNLNELKKLEEDCSKLTRENKLLEGQFKKITKKQLDPLYKIEIKKVVQKIGPQNLNVSYCEQNDYKSQENLIGLNQEIIENNKLQSELEQQIEKASQILKQQKKKKFNQGKRLEDLISNLNNQLLQ